MLLWFLALLLTLNYISVQTKQCIMVGWFVLVILKLETYDSERCLFLC